MSLNELLIHPYTVSLARLFLALVFFIASIGKLFQYKEFVQVVIAYEILPKSLSRLYAHLLPWLEVVIGLCLFLGLWVRIAALVAILLFTSFIIAIGINLARKRVLSCSCFGNFGQEKIGSSIILRNIVFLLLSAEVLQFYNGYLAVETWLFDRSPLQTPPPSGFIPVLLTAVLIGMAVLLIRQVFNLLQIDNVEQR